MSQLVARKPYSWFVARQDGKVTLGGFVPDTATGQGHLAALEAALPGMRIEDRQTVAFGAPEGFGAMTAWLLTAVPKLENGRVGLDDLRYCVEGRAKTAADVLALGEWTARPAAPGFEAVPCEVEPPIVSPYRWSAERTAGGEIVMRGSYPDKPAHEQILAALRRAFPTAPAVRDDTGPGSGAPPAFIAKVSRALADLARLRSGKADIEDGVYRLAGQGPDDHAACQSLKIQIAQQDGPDSVAQATIECPPAPPPEPAAMPDLPPIPGLNLDDVLPRETPAGASQSSQQQPAQQPSQPTVPWTARLAGGRLILEGALPDAAARAAVLAEAGRLFPSGTIEDRMTSAGGQTSGSTAEAAIYGLGLLSTLREGSVSVRDGTLSLSGRAADAGGWQALRERLAVSRPAGLARVEGADTVLVRPYELALAADRSGVRLSGYLPDETTRGALRALVGGSPLAGKLDDEAVAIVPGAPAGFAQAASAVLTDLLRLDIGSAVIGDDSVTLRGLTCRELIASEVRTSATTGLPPGFTADVAISPRQTGCVLDPPASCQNDLDGLTRQNPVLFAQGTAVVDLDPTTERVIAEAAAILRRCPDARVTIEGHANRDGDWRGFDNLDLSLRRAQRVRDELVRRGIEPVALSVKGYGTTRPLLPHGAPNAREMNRRVQFTVAK